MLKDSSIFHRAYKLDFPLLYFRSKLGLQFDYEISQVRQHEFLT